MKSTIKKIVFNVRGKELELTQDEAKELKGILLELFGETKVVHEYNTWPYQRWVNPWGITYSSSGSQFMGNLTNVDGSTLCLNAQTV